MKQTINKCDRCKKSVNDLIDVQMVNQNVEKEEEEEEKNPFSFFTMPARKLHPTLRKEICIDCATELCRWLDHSENLLLKNRKNAV